MPMSNITGNQQIVGQQIPVPMNAAQTIVDSNGQQFFMVPINAMPQSIPHKMNAPNVNAPTVMGGRTGGRSGRNGGQMRGRTGGRYRRSYTKPSGIFDAYCMDVAPLSTSYGST